MISGYLNEVEGIFLRSPKGCFDSAHQLELVLMFHMKHPELLFIKQYSDLLFHVPRETLNTTPLPYSDF